MLGVEGLTVRYGPIEAVRGGQRIAQVQRLGVAVQVGCVGGERGERGRRRTLRALVRRELHHRHALRHAVRRAWHVHGEVGDVVSDADAVGRVRDAVAGHGRERIVARLRVSSRNRLMEVAVAVAREKFASQADPEVLAAMRERAADLAPLLRDPNAYFFVCGLKSMEEGVVMAMRDIATGAGLDWEAISQSLQREGRLHLETY